MSIAAIVRHDRFVRLLSCFAVPALTLGAFAGCGAAQTSVRPLKIEDAVFAVRLHNNGRLTAVSPDGDWVAYTACDRKRVQIDHEKKNQLYAIDGAAYNTMGCDIWLNDAVGGASRNLTQGQGNSWSPVWSPDGRRLVFYSDRGGAPRLWVWDHGNEAPRRLSAQVTRTSVGTELPQWTPDGRQLLVKLRPAGMTDAELAVEASLFPKKEEPKEPGSTVVLYRSGPRLPSPATDTAIASMLGDWALADLGVIDATSGHARVLVPRIHVWGYRLSPDGTRAAYLEATTGGRRGEITILPGEVTTLYDLVVVDLPTGVRRIVASGLRQKAPDVSWSPDGRLIAYVSGRDTADPLGDAYVAPADGGPLRKLDGAPANSFSTDYTVPLWDAKSEHVYLVGRNRVWRGVAATGELAPVTNDTTRDVREIVPAADGARFWSADGTSLYVLTRDRRTMRNGYYKVDVATGAFTKLLEDEARFGRAFQGPVASANGRRIVYELESATRSADLWIAGVDFAAPRRLSALNPQLDQYTFGTARLIDFQSTDGVPLRGALLLPAGYKEGERYPLVVWVYASAMGSQHLGSFGLEQTGAFNLHMLTTRGYAVLWPDIPVGLGTPMQDLMKAVMPAIDRVVALGIADPERLAVMGQSGGGYSTVALITQTSRFKAALMNAGYGDQAALYGSMLPTSGRGLWIDWLERLGNCIGVPTWEERTGGCMGVPPWEAPLRYVQNSPIYYLDRVTTPLLMQAGSKDIGVVPHSDQVYVGLHRLGKEVTYLRYEGEAHVLAHYPNLVDYWNRAIAFLDQRLAHPQTTPPAGPKAPR